jgi:hypothetical protein
MNIKVGPGVNEEVEALGASGVGRSFGTHRSPLKAMSFSLSERGDKGMESSTLARSH